MASEPAAPAGADAASTGPADVAVQSTPASTGPDSSGAGDATATGTPPVPAPAKYRFLNREFDDQRKAEEAIGAEVGRSRGLQKEVAQLKADLQRHASEAEAMRSLLVAFQQSTGQGPGGSAPSGPQTLPDLLNKDKGFEFYQRLAEDPDVGVGGALYALAEDLGKHYESRFGTLEKRMDERFAAAEGRTEYERAVARSLTAASSLAKEYPELDESNQSEEAQEAQQQVLQIIQNTPLVMGSNGQQVPMGSVWLASNPAECIRWAVGVYRRTNGVPIFAQAPGTSGSPSSTAARAAEAAAAAGAAEPLDGTGVPRPRPDGRPMTLEDRWRTEKPRPEARSPSGRRLGFPEPL